MRWNEDLSKQLLPCSTHFVNYVYHAASLYRNYSYICMIQFNVRSYWLSFTGGCFDTLEVTHGQVGKATLPLHILFIMQLQTSL